MWNGRANRRWRLVAVDLRGDGRPPGGPAVDDGGRAAGEVVYTFAVPGDYAGGDLRVREWYGAGSAAADVRGARLLVLKRLPEARPATRSALRRYLDVSSLGDATARLLVIPARYLAPGDRVSIAWERRRRADSRADSRAVRRAGGGANAEGGPSRPKAVGVEYLAGS